MLQDAGLPNGATVGELVGLVRACTPIRRHSMRSCGSATSSTWPAGRCSGCRVLSSSLPPA
jgi:hypothetical protein